MSIVPRHLLSIAIALPILLTPSAAFGQVIFDSIANPLPGNVASLGFQATQTSEFGTGITFGPSPLLAASSVTVIMSSWACQTGAWNTAPAASCTSAPGSTFNHPITLKIYSVGPANSVGALLLTKTQTFALPYRPSASNLCVGADAGKWRDTAGNCFSGFAFPITFDTGSPVLPSSVIVTISFNTSNYGAAPIGPAACGANCPYDSLNVSAETSAPTVGSFTVPGGAYLNSSNAGNYCGGPAGTLRLDNLNDPNCWAVNQPQIRVTATPPGAFHVRYFSNLTVGDSYINITNAGTSMITGSVAANNGDICANVYTYSPDEQLISCCTCQVTPNGLAALSVKNDLTSNPLTPIVPTSVVVKMVATSAAAGACNAATVGTLGAAGLAGGMEAWGSTLHAVPGPTGIGISETPFSRAGLTLAELTRMSQMCAFIRANGSGYGVCKSCQVGGLGAKSR